MIFACQVALIVTGADHFVPMEVVVELEVAAAAAEVAAFQALYQTPYELDPEGLAEDSFPWAALGS